MKFFVNIPGYATGNIRFGRMQGIIEADSAADVYEAIQTRDIMELLDFVLDDYRLDRFKPLDNIPDIIPVEGTK